jgi:hypothetical protein
MANGISSNSGQPIKLTKQQEDAMLNSGYYANYNGYDSSSVFFDLSNSSQDSSIGATTSSDNGYSFISTTGMTSDELINKYGSSVDINNDGQVTDSELKEFLESIGYSNSEGEFTWDDVNDIVDKIQIGNFAPTIENAVGEVAAEDAKKATDEEGIQNTNVNSMIDKQETINTNNARIAEISSEIENYQSELENLVNDENAKSKAAEIEHQVEMLKQEKEKLEAQNAALQREIDLSGEQEKNKSEVDNSVNGSAQAAVQALTTD